GRLAWYQLSDNFHCLSLEPWIILAVDSNRAACVHHSPLRYRDERDASRSGFLREKIDLRSKVDRHHLSAARDFRSSPFNVGRRLPALGGDVHRSDEPL